MSNAILMDSVQKTLDGGRDKSSFQKLSNGLGSSLMGQSGYVISTDNVVIVNRLVRESFETCF